MLFKVLVLSLLLFSLGLYGILTRRSSVGLLISIEMMINAAILNFVVINRTMSPSSNDGQVMGIFAMALAASEVLAGIAILVMLFRQHKTADIVGLHSLKH